MAFLRIVEVFPPLFPISPTKNNKVDLESKIEEFVTSVHSIRSYSDLILIADVRNPALLKLSTTEAARILRQRAGIEVAPVIVVRDANRLQVLSSILTTIALGLKSLMLVWGDRYLASAHSGNVYDFPSLSKVIEEAVGISSRAGVRTRILAPVDLAKLNGKTGIARAWSRLEAGADILLAQPPTTDSGETFRNHTSVLEKAGLKSRVILSVFPFRGVEDVSYCARYFGWGLPRALYELSESGEEAILQEAKAVARRLRREKFPGVYLSTRGDPSVAKTVLA